MQAGRAWILAFLAIGPLLVGLGEAQSQDLRSVRDLQSRFTISIPVTWAVRTPNGDPAVSALSPAPVGEMPDSLEVYVRDLPFPISPEACVHQAEQVMWLTIHTFTTLEKAPGKVAGLQAYSHSYSWRTRGGVDRRSHQVCVTLGRRAFVLIGSTTETPPHISENLPVLERLIETFHPLAGAPDEVQHPWGPSRR